MFVNKLPDNLEHSIIGHHDRTSGCNRDNNVITNEDILLCKHEVMYPLHDAKDILTVDEVSFYLGLSKQYIYKLVQLKHIPFHKPGGKVLLFLRSELVKWVSTDGEYKGITQ